MTKHTRPWGELRDFSKFNHTRNPPKSQSASLLSVSFTRFVQRNNPYSEVFQTKRAHLRRTYLNPLMFIHQTNHHHVLRNFFFMCEAICSWNKKIDWHQKHNRIKFAWTWKKTKQTKNVSNKSRHEFLIRSKQWWKSILLTIKASNVILKT